MRKLQCDPETEIIGQTLLSYIDNIQAEEIHPYLEKYGLTEVDPEKWYPANNLMSLMNDMAAEANLSSNLVALGMATVAKMIIPPEMAALPLSAVLEGWNDLYYLQHRGGEIGYVKVEKITDHHYKTIHHLLYPDDMVYGVAYGLALRWLPKTVHFKIIYDADTPRRDNGGEDTIIHVVWD